MQSFGAVYVGHVVKSAGATNAVFAMVLGMLAFLYVTATVVVLCAEINVVRVDGVPAGVAYPVHRQRRPDRR